MRYWSRGPFTDRSEAEALLREIHAGFDLRERWHVAGEVADSLLYGLLAPEWRARPS